MLKNKKEVDTLYSMMIFANIIRNYGEYLLGIDAMGGLAKHEIKTLVNRVKDFHRTIRLVIPPNESSIFLREFTERDIAVYSSVIFLLNNMNDLQRETVELFAIEVSNGTASIAISEK